jgi:urease accessory protein
MHGGVSDHEDLLARRRGRIDLTFRRAPDGGTFLGRQYASYPFHICRPHRYVGDPSGMATLYLQSVAGGLFESDRLEVRIAAESGTALHVTSQASTVVHSMTGDHAEHAVTIEAGEGALVEYLPDATILFPQARLASRIQIQAHETASVICADAFLAHDPSGSSAMFDRLDSDMTVARPTGQVLVRDRFRITGDLLRRNLPGLNGPWIAQATVMVIHRGPSLDALLENIRAELEPLPDIFAGASRLPGDVGVWTRILACDGHALRTAVLAVWACAREQITAKRPGVRRK